MLSVVICAHNPRPDYLLRALGALRIQTLPFDRWEFLLIDNASKVPLTGTCDLSWHPKGRIIREEELGLTHARLCAMEEADGNILVFVDDDNLLSSDYLEGAAAIADEFPRMGAWGAGVIVPEFEAAPRPELEPYCEMLALRRVERDLWTNVPVMITEAVPYGAGLVVRGEVSQRYLGKKRSGGLIFGRTGQSLLSSEDLEIAFEAAALGLGYGVFTRLSLTHLIPARRVEPSYLLRLHEAMELSNRLLYLVHDRENGAMAPSYYQRLRAMLRLVERVVKARGVRRRFAWRQLRGNWRAFRMFDELCRTGGLSSSALIRSTGG